MRLIHSEVGAVVLIGLVSSAFAQTPQPDPKHPPGVVWSPTPEQHRANVELMRMKREGLLLPDRPGKK